MQVTNYYPVHGGDINPAYCLETTDTKYFLKINSADRFPGMFEKEARGLQSLSEACKIDVPNVIQTGFTKTDQFLLLDWIEPGSKQQDFWIDFGRNLALLHKNSKPFFGWHEDNYIGSLAQVNKKSDSWNEFFITCRILPLVELLVQHSTFSGNELDTVNRIMIKKKELFPVETPCLLHGDLWSGNFMVNKTGQAVIYDPAVYFGHREMDIGMSLLFGGFDKDFYEAYQEVYPLEKGWKERLPVAQLYPLLVHAVLFGGHYVHKAREILKKLV